MFLCLIIMDAFYLFVLFFFKQKTAYEMRISDWSSDVFSSDLQIYDVDFEPVEGAVRDHNAAGLHTLDHLTHNVNRGRMDHWAQFYERIFNFRQIRYFDIEGKQTALLSRAMTAPDDKIRIPLNESQDEHSQIE